MTGGYDKWRPNQGLLLDLQFRETTGTATLDWAKPYHGGATLTGAPTWAVLGNDLSYLSFTPHTDYIIIAAANCLDLGFTTSSFSGAIWIYPDAYGNRHLYWKASGAPPATGWQFWINAVSPYIAFTTSQAGPASQHTYGAAGLQLSAWQLVGFTRSGATAHIYLNGRRVTVTAGTHVDPAATAAVDFWIGLPGGAGAGGFDGRMWRPRIWNYALAAGEFLEIYEAEKELFGL